MASKYLLDRHQQLMDEAFSQYEAIASKTAKDLLEFYNTGVAKEYKVILTAEEALSRLRRNVIVWMAGAFAGIGLDITGTYFYLFRNSPLHENSLVWVICQYFVILIMLYCAWSEMGTFILREEIKFYKKPVLFFSLAPVFYIILPPLAQGAAYLILGLVFWCYLSAMNRLGKRRAESKKIIKESTGKQILASRLADEIKKWTICAEKALAVPGKYEKLLYGAEGKYQQEANAYKDAVKKSILVFHKQLTPDAVEWMKHDFKSWHKREYRPAADVFSMNCWRLSVENAHVQSCTGENMVFGVYGMQPLRSLSDRSAMAYVMGRTMKELLAAKYPELSVTMEYNDNEVFLYL